VVVVGGGPQYRVGGHRQLVLWGRRLAAEGYPVLRFDYRGMGDSHGGFTGFETVDDDIRAAVDCLQREVPSLRDVVLWGECDASSAILFYAYRDARVAGIVLLNPWARTESGQAKTFCKMVFGLRFNPVSAARDVVRVARLSRAASPATPPQPAGPEIGRLAAPMSRELPLPERLLTGFERFSGAVLLVMSKRDFIAREFDELLAADPAWGKAIAAKRFERHDMADGDHTFSSAEQRNRVVGWALEWLRSW
jgi:exosortase A-associated hydrolase 1